MASEPYLDRLVDYREEEELGEYRPPQELREKIQEQILEPLKLNSGEHKPTELVDVVMQEIEVEEPESLRPYFDYELSRMIGSKVRRNPDNTLVDISENGHAFSYF